VGKERFFFRSQYSKTVCVGWGVGQSSLVCSFFLKEIFNVFSFFINITLAVPKKVPILEVFFIT
jgi:hypothetical protein